METDREQSDQGLPEPATETQWTVEDDLAAELGLGRDAMRAMRKAHLREDVSWRRRKRRVELSPEAVTLIRSIVGAPDTAAVEPKKDRASSEQLTVRRIPRNQRILEAEKKDGRLVRVRVRDNRNFVPGMEIRAVHLHGDFEDVMTLEGRCPRWRGRW